MIKKLSKKQAKELSKGKLPDDWWNYGINPLLGYRINNGSTPKRAIYNSLPVPNGVDLK